MLQAPTFMHSANGQQGLAWHSIYREPSGKGAILKSLQSELTAACTHNNFSFPRCISPCYILWGPHIALNSNKKRYNTLYYRRYIRQISPLPPFFCDQTKKSDGIWFMHPSCQVRMDISHFGRVIWRRRLRFSALLILWTCEG